MNSNKFFKTTIKNFNKFVSSNPFKIISIILIIIFLPRVLIEFLPYGPAEIIALLLGVIALFQSFISKTIIAPIIELDVRELIDNNPQNIKWYNLSIKNKGLSRAKGIEIKIKDRTDREWINLMRPFSEILEYNNLDTIKIDLSPWQEEDFNFLCIDQNNNIILKTIAYPQNQQFIIKNKTKKYYLEIISDNARTLFYDLEIIHASFNKFNKSNIKIRKIGIF